MACKEYLTLNNGLRMPAIGLGTWRAPDAEVETAINDALKIGYRHFDCAPVYMNEKTIGKVFNEWITSTKITREELFIVTKLPPHAHRPGSVKKFLKNSLADLKLDYVDLYLIHTPFGVPEVDGPFLTDEETGNLILDMETDHISTWHMMEKMVADGLTKGIGISNFNKQQIENLFNNSVIKPSCLQIELHLYLQQHDLVNYCKTNNIAVTAYAPLGSQGIEKLHQSAGIERAIPNLLKNPEVNAIAKRLERSPAQILLRYLMERGVSAIPKSTNPVRLRQNIDVFDFKLTKKDMLTLNDLDQAIRLCDFAFFPGMKNHPEFPF